MPKARKLAKKERKKMKEVVSSKGERHFLYNEHGKFYPFCIICDKIIRSGQYLTAIWEWEELERNYVYAVCLECQNKLFDAKTTEQIEEKLMLLASVIQRFKGKILDKE